MLITLQHLEELKALNISDSLKRINTEADSFDYFRDDHTEEEIQALNEQYYRHKLECAELFKNIKSILLSCEFDELTNGGSFEQKELLIDHGIITYNGRQPHLWDRFLKDVEITANKRNKSGSLD